MCVCFGFMGKSLPSPTRLRDIARIVASNNLSRPPKPIRPVSKTRVAPSREPTRGIREELRVKKMEESSAEERRLVPLAAVVSACVRRWFRDTLKEAQGGDGAMQVLVSQMYYSGYGVPRDPQKGRAWINRASKNRSSVWISDKQLGYHASDSDSDDMKGVAK